MPRDFFEIDGRKQYELMLALLQRLTAANLYSKLFPMRRAALPRPSGTNWSGRAAGPRVMRSSRSKGSDDGPLIGQPLGSQPLEGADAWTHFVQHSRTAAQPHGCTKRVEGSPRAPRPPGVRQVAAIRCRCDQASPRTRWRSGLSGFAAGLRYHPRGRKSDGPRKSN